jgi:hypothetical protein
VKDSKHDQPFAIEGVVKDIFCFRDFQHQLPEVRASLDRPTDQRIFREDSGLMPDFSGNNLRQVRMSILKEVGKTVEIGQRSSRLFKFH